MSSSLTALCVASPGNIFFNTWLASSVKIGAQVYKTYAFSIEIGQVRAMQRFVSDAPWDEETIMIKYRNMVKDDLGHPSSAIIFDETGFVKKGKDSIGASKQYCGTLGKVDNCQVGVFALYASPYGNALIDKRLYLPQL